MGKMILFRAEMRRRKLEMLSHPTKLTKEGVDGMKEEVVRCKNWEVAVQGWREALEYREEQKREEERAEREAQVVAEDTMPLEAGLTEALTCHFCRLSCSTVWNLKRHRWVDNLCFE